MYALVARRRAHDTRSKWFTLQANCPQAVPHRKVLALQRAATSLFVCTDIGSRQVPETSEKLDLLHGIGHGCGEAPCVQVHPLKDFSWMSGRCETGLCGNIPPYREPVVGSTPWEKCDFERGGTIVVVTGNNTRPYKQVGDLRTRRPVRGNHQGGQIPPREEDRSPPHVSLNLPMLLHSSKLLCDIGPGETACYLQYNPINRLAVLASQLCK